MKRLRLRAPATVANVGPGFDIFALALEHPADHFEISLSDVPGDVSIQFAGDDDNIPVEPGNNTAGLTARHILGEAGRPTGMKIDIIKGMPSSSGLGSSAASAAACAFGLDRLLNAGMSQEEMIEAGRLGEVASGGTAHADNVAACLLGGFVFIRRYDPLDVVRIPLPDIPIVIRVTRKEQTTTRGMIPDQFSLDEIKLQSGFCAEVIRAVMTSDVEGFGRAVNQDLISEPVRARGIPGYDELKKEVLAAGAYGCNVSGGGSSVFAVCPPGKTEEIAGLMRTRTHSDGKPFDVIVTRSSNRGIEVIDES